MIYKALFGIIYSHCTLKKIIFMLIIVLTNGLALLGAEQSAGTMVIDLKSHLYIGLPLKC